MLGNIYIRIATVLIKAAIAVIPSVLIVRIFGVKLYGTISYYFSIIGIFSLFSDLGLSRALLKYLAADEEPKQSTTAYLLFKTALSIIFLILIFGAYILKFRDDHTFDRMFLLIAMVVTLSDIYKSAMISIFQGRRDFKDLSIYEIIAQVVMVTHNIFFCVVYKNVYLLACGTIIYNIIVAAGGLRYCLNKNLLVLRWPKKEIWICYIRYALPLCFSTIVGHVMTYLDKILLARLIGVGELGFYNIASNGYKYIESIIRPITLTLYTEIIHEVAAKADFVKMQMRKIVELLNVSAAYIVIGIMFCSVTAITIMYGKHNLRSAYLFMFFSLLVFSKLFWRPYHQIMYALEKHAVYSYLSLLSPPITAGLYYLLIPHHILGFEIGGAAIPFTEFVLWIFPGGLYITFALKKKYRVLHMKRILLFIWLPVVLIIIVGGFFHFALPVLPIALGIFTIVMFYFGILSKERIAQLLVPVKSTYYKFINRKRNKE